MSITHGAAPEHPLLAGVRVVGEGLDEALDANVWSLSGADEITQALLAVECASRRLCALSLRLMAEADGRGVARLAGARSTAGWVGDLLQLPGKVAAGRVRLANALREGATCAATGHALAAGRVSLEQAQVIERTVRALPDRPAPPDPSDPPDETADETADDTGDETAEGGAGRGAAERFLLERAHLFAPPELGKLGRHLRNVLDPDGEDELARDEAAQRAARELHTTLGADGMWHLRGRLDGVSGALLAELLEPLAKPHPAGPEGPDPRSKARRQADGFTELLQLAARAGQAPEAGGERPHLTVTLSWETLTRQLGAPAADLAHGLPICAATARMLACDAAIVPVVLGSASEPLDVGRSTRTIPAAIRRALTVRDGGCAWPGCDVPPARCDAHHVEHWADGGETEVCNLCLLCSRHHFFIHHDGWTLHIDPDGHPTFTPPRWIDAQQKPVRSRRATINEFHRRE